MTILEILQNQQASLEEVLAFEKNETPISTVDLYRDKLQLADIFFMDEKYREFFDNCEDIRYAFAINKLLSTFEALSSYTKEFHSIEDINEYITENNEYIFSQLHNNFSQVHNTADIRYYYINLHIEFEEDKYIISAKYSIDRGGNKKLIDLLNITEVYWYRHNCDIEEVEE